MKTNPTLQGEVHPVTEKLDNRTEGTNDGQLGIIVDYLFRDLDAYEASLYVFLYRKSIYVGEPSIRMGKRSISSEFVRGARGGGEGNKGGLWVSYQHISRALKSLELKGCIKLGDTNREGTLYTVVSPQEIPSVANRLLTEKSVSVSAPNYFSDPVRRKEVFERDHWICRYCGERLTPDTATLDHFIPQSKGGGHDMDNLRSSCLMCNSIKSGRSYDEVAPLLLDSIVRRRSKEGGE